MIARALAPSSILLGALLAFASPAAANPHLDKCRSLEGEFDYKGMVPECGLVVADSDASAEERIEAHRLLGFAHTALGDDDAAREWFVRLLVLDPDHALPEDMSPRFREVFARAVEHMKEKGRVTVVHEPPTVQAALAGDPLVLSFEVRDALARVASADVIVDAIIDGEAGEPVTAPLKKLAAGQEGVARFEGELVDPAVLAGASPASYTLRYRLVLSGPVGAEVIPDPPVPPITLPRHGDTAGAVSTGEGNEALLWSGAAIAGGLVVAGLVGGSVALYCATGRCSSRVAQPPVGYVNVSVAGAGALP